MRDRQLDILRGFTMIHIVCVIHVLWYFGLAREPLFSFLLFEMPAIFFIAGASQKIKNNGNNKDNYYHSGNNNSGIWSDLLSLGLNRIRRILFPYWRFCIISLSCRCHFFAHRRHVYRHHSTHMARDNKNHYDWRMHSYPILWLHLVYILLSHYYSLIANTAALAQSYWPSPLLRSQYFVGYSHVVCSFPCGRHWNPQLARL